MNKRVHVPGIADQEFIRGDVPMTKEEIRTLTLCKAKIQPWHIVYDVGAGTGSICVEAALMAYAGKVYAVERDAEGIDLIKQNAGKFGLDNVIVVHGKAPQALKRLPVPDVVIIGGSGGALEEILDVCGNKLSGGGKMIINAVTLETLCKAQVYFAKSQEYGVDFTCLSVTKILPAGASHIFRAHNPVYIITATKDDQHER
jgi:precorrin-6Y C5,15-methyltransferase (decarboxylating) CbiT subunit